MRLRFYRDGKFSVANAAKGLGSDCVHSCTIEEITQGLRIATIRDLVDLFRTVEGLNQVDSDGRATGWNYLLMASQA